MCVCVCVCVCEGCCVGVLMCLNVFCACTASALPLASFVGPSEEQVAFAHAFLIPPTHTHTHTIVSYAHARAATARVVQYVARNPSLTAPSGTRGIRNCQAVFPFTQTTMAQRSACPTPSHLSMRLPTRFLFVEYPRALFQDAGYSWMPRFASCLLRGSSVSLRTPSRKALNAEREAVKVCVCVCVWEN